MALSDLPPEKKNAKDAAMFSARGEACIHRGDFAAALAWFDKALESDPRSAQAYAGKGFALRSLKRDKEALLCYNAALETGTYQVKSRPEKMKKLPARQIAPGTEISHTPSGGQEAKVVVQTAEPADRLSADAWYDKAIRFAVTGDLARALNCFDKALEFSPDYADYWISRGRVLGKLGRYSGALESLDRALVLRPDDAGALYYRGVTLTLMGKLSDAYACFESLLRAHPGHTEAAAALADLVKIMGRVKDRKAPEKSSKQKRSRAFL